MSKCPNRDSLSSIVIETTKEMLILTNERCATFATSRVVPLLENQGLIKSDATDDTADAYIRWRNRTTKQVERILNSDVRMPADWVVTWISALPEPYRTKCRTNVAALLGLMCIPMPTYTPKRHVLSIHAEIDAITVKFGSVLSASEPAQDGVYDDHDSRLSLQALQNELQELVARTQREIINIEVATGVIPDAVKIGRDSPINGGV